MKKFKQMAMRLLFPHKAVVWLLVIISAAALIYVFTNGLENTLIAYITYPLSFYALCTVVARIPDLCKRSREAISSHPHAAKYFTEQDLRIRRSLHRSTVLNLAFGLFKVILGIVYRSFWFGAVGIYYMVLCLTRYLLIRKDREIRHQPDNEQLHLLQWQGYRTGGGFLLILNATMSGIVFQSIWQNQSYEYPGFIIYASAAYTFYRLTMAIIQNIKLRSHSKPLFLAAKTMDLSAALMSIFALQTAMFTTFGSDTEETLRQLMNTLTGGAVCFIVVCMAVYMLVRAHKEIKAFNIKR